MPDAVIATKLANMLVEDATADLPPFVDSLPGMEAVEPVLAGFRRVYGGLWVGGRATLTTAAFSFAANAANRALQSGTVDLQLPLSAISEVSVQGGFLTNIMVINVGSSLVKVRCFGAAAFADLIRATAGR